MSDVWLSALPTPTPPSFKNFQTCVFFMVDIVRSTIERTMFALTHV